MTGLHSGKAWILICLLAIGFPLLIDIIHAQNCEPPCRSGYECMDGTCVSQCNPPCPENQKCDPTTHECVPVIPQSTDSAVSHNSGGFAFGSAVAGFVVSPIILGLAIGSAATVGNDLVPALPLGAAGLGIGAISVPVIAIGGAVARSGEKVSGVLGLRIAGWSGYGFSLATGVVMIGLAVGGATVPPGPVLACGMLATFSCLSFSIDNLIASTQAKKHHAGVENKVSVPELTLGFGPYSKNGATIQLGLRF